MLSFGEIQELRKRLEDHIEYSYQDFYLPLQKAKFILKLIENYEDYQYPYT